MREFDEALIALFGLGHLGRGVEVRSVTSHLLSHKQPGLLEISGSGPGPGAPDHKAVLMPAARARWLRCVGRRVGGIGAEISRDGGGVGRSLTGLPASRGLLPAGFALNVAVMTHRGCLVVGLGGVGRRAVIDRVRGMRSVLVL